MHTCLHTAIEREAERERERERKMDIHMLFVFISFHFRPGGQHSEFSALSNNDTL